MGAISPGRWQPWHLAWRMGATSFVKEGAPCALAPTGIVKATVAATSKVRPRVVYFRIGVRLRRFCLFLRAQRAEQFDGLRGPLGLSGGQWVVAVECP